MTTFDMAVGGSFLVGIAFGFWLYRQISAQAHRNWFGESSCDICARTGYVAACRRCGRKAGICCTYSVLGYDRPGEKLRPRRGGVVCTACLSSEERKMLEKVVEGIKS